MLSGWQWRWSQAASAFRSSVATMKIAPSFTQFAISGFLDLGGARPEKANLRRKLLRLSRYYAQLIRYATFSKSQADFSGDTESKS